MALFRFGRRDEPKPRPEAAAGEQPPVIAAATDAVAAPPRQGFLERLRETKQALQFGFGERDPRDAVRRRGGGFVRHRGGGAGEEVAGEIAEAEKE